MDIIVALDVGTSSIRSVLFNMSGSIEAVHSYSYSPNFLSGGRVRQAASTWEQGLTSIFTKTAATCKEKGLIPTCVAITSQRASVIPVGSDNQPLADAIMWQDKSTSEQCDQILARFSSKEIYKRTGLRVDSYFSAPKILWLQSREPEIYKASSRLLGVQDYVSYLVTGEYFTDYSQASRTLLFNITNLSWDEDILRELSISPDKLPQAVPPGTRISGTSSAFQKKTGFPADVPVILAGGDQQVAALGMGVIEPGRAEANTGTGSFLITPIDTPIFHPEMRTLCSAAAIPNRWVAEAGILTTGILYQWFARELSGDKESDSPEADQSAKLNEMEMLNKLASKAPPGSNGVVVLPHFSGSAAPFWNPDARGIFANLTLSTTKADLARAILESIALELAMNLELITNQTGHIQDVAVAGGLTKFPLFNQIQADAFNVPVSVSTIPEASSFGAVLSALVTLGHYSGYREAYQALTTQEDEQLYPDAKNNELYAKYQKLRRQLHDTIQDAGLYSEMRSL